MANRIFGIDASSFQGNVDWAAVDRICDFGAEKVTEGTGYSNPYWPVAKIAMTARAKASGFIPLAYMFLDAVEPGAAQADYFHSKAGNLGGFGIVVDVERAPNGSPTIRQASDAVARLRQLYPHHPVGGYIPHWFSGAADLRFADWLWASSYVGGSGDPTVLFFSVPQAWWAPYGGMAPLLLQFTDKARVTGVNGAVDCSAFQGTISQLARAVLPQTAPAPAPVPSTAGDAAMSADATTLYVEPGAPHVFFPVHAQQPAGEPSPWVYNSLVVAGPSGAVVRAVLHYDDGTAPATVTVPLESGKAAKVAAPSGWGKVSVVELSRLDTKADLGVIARFISW